MKCCTIRRKETFGQHFPKPTKSVAVVFSVEEVPSLGGAHKPEAVKNICRSKHVSEHVETWNIFKHLETVTKKCQNKTSEVLSFELVPFFNDTIDAGQHLSVLEFDHVVCKNVRPLVHVPTRTPTCSTLRLWHRSRTHHLYPAQMQSRYDTPGCKFRLVFDGPFLVL